MSLLAGTPGDYIEEAAIERRRQIERERLMRIKDPRQWKVGVDTDALAAQIVASVQHKDQCPTPTGSWRGACQASTCTISGNGTCVLECQCKGVLGKMNTRRCNLLACSDLAVNAAGEFTCGGKVCPAD